VVFKVIVGRRQQAFKLQIGPGDNDEAVLTLMLPGEG